MLRAHSCRTDARTAAVGRSQARVHQHQCEFIALQALEHEHEFFLWQRAGTLGSAGKPLLVGPFECAERAVVEFCSVFSAKTNCAWAERHSLQYQDGRYTPVVLIRDCA